MKLFFISDIHSFYDETIEALKKAKYDENNPNHLLIVVGDIFDRGRQTLQVYEWLLRLTRENKAIVLSGNHHKFLIDFLKGSISPFNYINNGLKETIADFWHRTAPFESWCIVDENCEITQEAYEKWVNICRKDINREYPELLPWLESMPRYFESKSTIATHGALDLHVPDWHYPHCSKYWLRDWDALDFDDGSFLGVKNTTGKKIIIGHYDTGSLRKIYGLGNKNDYSILETKDNKVFIDGCVALTKKVNVYVIEDDLLEVKDELEI